MIMIRKVLVSCLSVFVFGCSSGNSSTIPKTVVNPTTSSFTVVGDDGKNYVIPAEPDPTVNSSTVGGIDSDNDGIRDDVERWIAATWKPGSKEYFAVRQLARVTQHDITDTDSINNVTKHARMDEKA